MRRHTTLLALVGLGSMLSGTVGAAAASATAAAPARSLEVRLSAGPSLVDRSTTLTLDVTVAATSGAPSVAVTDLLPAGRHYVSGSARLGGPAGVTTPAEPRVTSSASGTLLVWPSLTPPPGTHQQVVTWRVAAPPAGATPAGAGSIWTDRATALLRRAGTSAPALSPTGRPAVPDADLQVTAQCRAEVVALWAGETGRSLSPSVGGRLPPGAQPVEEHLTIRSSAAARLTAATVRVYLRGAASWVGCLAAGCRRPTVTQTQLPVTPGRPDFPDLPAAAPSPPPSTACPPAGPSPSAAKGCATTTAAGGAPATAPFTVLTWRLGVLPAAEVTTVDYRIDAAPTTQKRTADVVTATATTPAPATTPPTTASAISSPITTASPTTASPTTASPTTASPTTARLSTVRATTVRTTTVRTTTVQAWPAAVPAVPRSTPQATTATTTAPRTNAATAAGVTASTSTSTSTTSTTTLPPSSADPFGSTGSGPAATTTAPGVGNATTTTTTPGTTTTTAPAPTGSLASTGADIRRTVEGGLALSGAGALLLVAGRRRRSRHRTGSGRGRAPDADR
jgi:hypothetical protein